MAPCCASRAAALDEDPEQPAHAGVALEHDHELVALVARDLA
jgi:hypothetical protein